MSGTPSSHWIPVTESLPDSDTTVLTGFSDGEVSMGFHDGESWCECDGMSIRENSPTHWMDLPEGPGQ